jgi:dihydroorotate dehydrogenase
MDLYALARPFIFSLPAETAHQVVVGALARGLGPRVRIAPDPRLRIRAFGCDFPHPVGLAAGMDKEGEAVAGFAGMGFGHVEVGTVTAQAQPGNPRPRAFRLIADEALINRFGFNNHGAAACAQRLAALPRPRPCVVGVNVGKTKVVPNEQALADLQASIAATAIHADYLVVNISSPNTPGLRDLQAEHLLRPLLAGVRSAVDQAAPGKAVLLKIAPDLADAGIDAAVDAALECRIDGLICTNTTISRDGLAADPAHVAGLGAGGLSGRPLRQRSLAVLARVARRLRAQNRGDLPLIGVGGIDSAEAAWERIGHGASLVQVYSALIFRGPWMVRGIVTGLGERLDRSGLPDLASAVGRDL